MTAPWVAVAMIAAAIAMTTLLAARFGRRPPRLLLLLLLASACCMLTAVLVQVHGGSPGLADSLRAAGMLLLVPMAIAVYPDGRPAGGLGWLSVVPLAAAGGLAVAFPATYSGTGVVATSSFLLLAMELWWRYEHPTGQQERRAVLWLGLGCGTGGLLAVLTDFTLAPVPAVVVSTILAIGACGCLFVGLVSPDVRDVRSAAVATVVHLVTIFVVLAAYVMVLASLQLMLGSPVDDPGTLGVVAAVLAIGYHPTSTVLRGVIDRLVLGERRPPLETVSRVSAQGDDPDLALSALRQSLSLPYAALLDGVGEVVASSGAVTSLVVTEDLRPAEPAAGRITVGLRPGEVALPHRDREVLAFVGPALAQLLRARALGVELQESRSRVVQAVEEERRRLRRDLHDGLGPRLTGVAYTADAARNLLRLHPERATELLGGLRQEAGDAIAEVRRLVDGLRPPSLDQVGLVEALRQHARGLIGADGLPLVVEVEARPLPALGAAVEVATYRIVVEALTNAARHSGGQHCRVLLRCADGIIVAEVHDDGPGRTEWTPGVGMASMHERAEMLGGTLAVGFGRVVARLPV